MSDQSDRAAPPSKRCPICGRPAIAQLRPFCSMRCKTVDLNRWLSGAYVIPADESGQDERDRPPAADDDRD